MNESIDSLMNEKRRFAPTEEFARNALVDESHYAEAADDRLEFWAKRARELHWHEDFTEVLDWQPPHAKWFQDGKINVAYNCLDRHVEAGNGDRVAFYWEGEPGDKRTITYADMTAEVKRLANVLLSMGVKKRRPRRHLPADDPRSGRLDAGLRSHRRNPHDGLRRLQPPEPAHAHRRRRRQGGHHLRRLQPQGQGLRAQAHRSTRRSRSPATMSRTCWSCAAARTRSTGTTTSTSGITTRWQTPQP